MVSNEMKLIPLACLLIIGCARGAQLDSLDHTPMVAGPIAAAADGKWWCFDLNNPGATDGLAYCERSRTRCKKMRKHADRHDKQPGECTAQDTAFCFDVSFKGHILEICNRTLPQCKQLATNTSRDNYPIMAECAERRNDKPPSGGVAHVEYW